MPISNPEFMKGTGGTPDFLVVGEIQTAGNKLKVGIRPLFSIQGSLSSGKFMVDISYRVRMQEVSNTPIDATGFEHLVTPNLAAGCHAFKIKSDYASFMYRAVINGKLGDDLQKDLGKVKKALGNTVADITNTLSALNIHYRDGVSDITLFFLTTLGNELATQGFDIGDTDTPDIPKDQPINTKFKQANSAKPTATPTAKKKTSKPDPKPAPEPDKYELKDVSDEDLSGMSFDDLMGAISKKPKE